MKICLTLWLLFISNLNCFSQQKPLSVITTRYTDFYTQGSRLYGLTSGDTLTVWDTISPVPLRYITGVKAIAPNKYNELCYVKNGLLNNLSKQQVISKDSFDSDVYKLYFDTAGQPVLCTSKGIFYKGQYLLPHKDDDSGIVSYREGPDLPIMWPPHISYLDDSNRLWLGYDNGEHGGGLLYADLANLRIVAPESLYYLYYDKYRDTEYTNDENLMNLDMRQLVREFPEKVKLVGNDTLIKFPYDIIASRPKGITGDRIKTLYFSESTVHFFLWGVNILKVSKTGYKDYYKLENLNTFLERDKKGEIVEYVGPVAYNSFNGHAYYYSQLGFFKIIETSPGKYSKQLIVKPDLLWSGQQLAIGSAMNVKQFKFTAANKFFFLTTNNGIGYFNGSTIKYFH